MNIGERIINEIIQQGMINVTHPDPATLHVITWNGNAAEQLTALVADALERTDAATAMSAAPMTTTMTERPALRSSGEAPDSAPELFVEVRLYNRPGCYRVLTIGGDGQKDSDMDAARLLRKLALWVETKGPNCG